MIAVMEDVYDQLCRNKAFNDHHIAKHRVQTILKAFTYNYLDLDLKQFSTDQKHIKVLRRLRERCMILKPDKGQGVVLIGMNDYIHSLKRIFDDTSKFKVRTDDPTLRNLSNVQSYLNTLLARDEITEEQKKSMRPKAAHLGRANGLPKIHKQFDSIPPFRPIVDTTDTPHYGIGKFLSQLLYPLTTNTYTVKDSFEAINHIQSIPKELFAEGYQYVSFDVTSLFTNVPLNKTINVALDRIYDEKLIKTKLKRRTLKKLLLDACTKTAFSFNNVIYEQIDGVSMGSSLGPTLANLIMTELEKVVVDKLIQSGIVKFYIRYVDDTLLLAKPEHFDEILRKMNSFDNNLQFTIDRFSDGNIHFLDISVNENATDIFYKPTHTGQYCHYLSQTPWRLKTAWVKALYHRAKKICSSVAAFNNQLSKIKLFMAWNGYPSFIAKSMFKRLQSTSNENAKNQDDDKIKIFVKVPFIGEKGEQLLKSCIRKLHRFTKNNVVFVKMFDTKKVSMFCPVKDKISVTHKSNVIYKLKCPGCGEIYIGKTDRCLIVRLQEHGTRKDQPMFHHLSQCQAFHDYVSIFNLPSSSDTFFELDKREYIKNTVLSHYSIVDTNCNWSQLSYLEALYIKRLSPCINKGLKASKELQLFT